MVYTNVLRTRNHFARVGVHVWLVVSCALPVVTIFGSEAAGGWSTNTVARR